MESDSASLKAYSHEAIAREERHRQRPDWKDPVDLPVSSTPSDAASAG